MMVVSTLFLLVILKPCLSPELVFIRTSIGHLRHCLRIIPRLIYSSTALYVAQNTNASATIWLCRNTKYTRVAREETKLINPLGGSLTSNVYSQHTLGLGSGGS
ncbi:hypothetical protein EDC04DRAFT_2627951 [Pisolithus marmoratus]|nr:hypothetical protein EDC04DRAFT_2627951 [Pisolithus marmoratus]